MYAAELIEFKFFIVIFNDNSKWIKKTNVIMIKQAIHMVLIAVEL